MSENHDSKSREHKCTCGRTFYHRISLNRHLRVSGCQPPEGYEDLPTPPKAPVLISEEEEAPTATRPRSAAAPAETSELELEMPADPVPMVVLEGPYQEPVPTGPSRWELMLQTGWEFSVWLGQHAASAADWTVSRAAECVPVVKDVLVRAAALLVVVLVGLAINASSSRSGPSAAPITLAAPARAAEPEVPRPIAAQAPAPVEATEKTIAEFYRCVNCGSLGRAYGLLSPAWQRELPYLSFEAGFQETREVRCDVLASRELGHGQAEVEVVLEVTESGEPARYTGSYVLTAGDGGWMLDGGRLHRAPGQTAAY